MPLATLRPAAAGPEAPAATRSPTSPAAATSTSTTRTGPSCRPRPARLRDRADGRARLRAGRGLRPERAGRVRRQGDLGAAGLARADLVRLGRGGRGLDRPATRARSTRRISARRSATRSRSTRRAPSTSSPTRRSIACAPARAKVSEQWRRGVSEHRRGEAGADAGRLGDDPDAARRRQARCDHRQRRSR